MDVKLRFGPGEWIGAFGDIGTLLPLTLALGAFRGVPLANAFAVFGLAYLVTGAVFKVPLPVQPLKAMAAILLATDLIGPGYRQAGPVMQAAAFWMGILFLLLAWTGGIQVVQQLFTAPLIRGVQFAVGLMLLQSAWAFLFSPVLPVVQADAGGWAWPGFPGLREAGVALWALVLPQLALTLGNSVAATGALAQEYFGDGARRVTPGALARSIGWGNLLTGFVAGIPFCHGSSGLTAHYQFGARTWGASLIIGFFYLGLAVVFGAGAGAWVSRLHPVLLALMVGYVGIWHALLIRRSPRPWIPLVMGGVALFTRHVTLALVLGWILDAISDVIWGLREISGQITCKRGDTIRVLWRRPEHG